MDDLQSRYEYIAIKPQSGAFVAGTTMRVSQLIAEKKPMAGGRKSYISNIRI
jgi:hypothetical protein